MRVVVASPMLLLGSSVPGVRARTRRRQPMASRRKVRGPIGRGPCRIAVQRDHALLIGTVGAPTRQGIGGSVACESIVMARPVGLPTIAAVAALAIFVRAPGSVARGRFTRLTEASPHDSIGAIFDFMLNALDGFDSVTSQRKSLCRSARDEPSRGMAPRVATNQGGTPLVRGERM
jgi:hypothetical protein